MTVILLKMLHVAGIAVWAGGLLALPVLFHQRRNLEGTPLYDLHSFTRFLYVGFVSPAAFVATASGVVLIFLQGTFVAWFSWKLLLVAIMGGIHLMAGRRILKLFEPGESYSALHMVLTSGATVLVATGILVLVLAKPVIGGWPFVETLLAPGELEAMLRGVIAWSK